MRCQVISLSQRCQACIGLLFLTPNSVFNANRIQDFIWLERLVSKRLQDQKQIIKGSTEIIRKGSIKNVWGSKQYFIQTQYFVILFWSLNKSLVDPIFLEPKNMFVFDATFMPFQNIRQLITIICQLLASISHQAAASFFDVKECHRPPKNQSNITLTLYWQYMQCM